MSSVTFKALHKVLGHLWRYLQGSFSGMPSHTFGEGLNQWKWLKKVISKLCLKQPSLIIPIVYTVLT